MSSSIACILQVEDDEHDVFFLQYAFRQAGITNPLRVVSDGDQAIDYLAGAGKFADRTQYPLPSLVLLDLKLARTPGLEVLRWLHRQPALRTIVVVVFTSACDPTEVERCYQCGANAFVVKPVGVRERLEFAKLLKGWWLGRNQFAPSAEAGAMPADCLGVAQHSLAPRSFAASLLAPAAGMMAPSYPEMELE